MSEFEYKNIEFPKPEEIIGNALIKPLELWGEKGWNCSCEAIFQLAPFYVVSAKNKNRAYRIMGTELVKVERIYMRPTVMGGERMGKPCICKDCMEVHKDYRHHSKRKTLWQKPKAARRKR